MKSTLETWRSRLLKVDLAMVTPPTPLKFSNVVKPMLILLNYMNFLLRQVLTYQVGHQESCYLGFEETGAFELQAMSIHSK